MPTARWSFVPRTAAVIAAVTSPSWMSLIRHRLAELLDQIMVARAVEHDRGDVVRISAERLRDRVHVLRNRLGQVDATARATGPTAILRTYICGSFGIVPGSPTAIIAIAPWPLAGNDDRPLSGSTARSTGWPPLPTTASPARPLPVLAADHHLPLDRHQVEGSPHAGRRGLGGTLDVAAPPEPRPLASAARSVTAAYASALGTHCRRRSSSPCLESRVALP